MSQCAYNMPMTAGQRFGTGKRLYVFGYFPKRRCPKRGAELVAGSAYCRIHARIVRAALAKEAFK